MMGSIRFGRRAMTVAAATLMAGGALFGILGPTPGASAAVGGPVLILGVDCEDHGPVSSYDSLVDNLYGNVTNGGSGVLVLGSGKSPGDGATSFWDSFATDSGRSVTQVSGANIGTQSFAGYGVIAVVTNGVSGGLDDTDNTALITRAADIAAHVNGGGGLLVCSQGGLTEPYSFLSTLGAITWDFVNTGDDGDIDINANGTAAGLTDVLDPGPWHDQFLTWPSFLVPLATYAGSTEVAALGGASVVIGPVTGEPKLTLDPSATTEPPSTVPPTTEPPTTEPPTTGTTTPGTTPPGGVFYENCPAARAAGVENIPIGTPGYRPVLDGDADGIACERVEGATAARPRSGAPTFTG